MTRRVRCAVALTAAVGFGSVFAGCGSIDGKTAADCGTVQAAFASFDPYANTPQRIMAGLICDNGNRVTGGAVQFAFTFIGTRDMPLSPGTPGPSTAAQFTALPSPDARPPSSAPAATRPSQVTGVYAATVALPTAGLWELQVSSTKGLRFAVKTTFAVSATPRVVAVGDRAPATKNPVAGDATTPASAIDSRAQDGSTIPDPELHSTSVADALAAGKPMVVVVSTPVYCQSQFCGPVTDMVAQLQKQFGNQVAFIHLEVWRDFANSQPNDAALEWIGPKDGTDANEPWVFVVGADGTVSARFDNIATESDLRTAIEQVLAKR
ncbi:MAG: hypothetical protein ACOYNI_08600 [Acidimicrobiia bacterium]